MMQLTKSLQRFGVVLAASGLLLGQVAPVSAAMVTTPDAVQQAQQHLDRERLLELLERDSVREQLREYGVDADAAKQRVAAMTDEEVRQLNARLSDMPAGGDILSLAVLLFIVFIITDMLGATDIFTFVHPINK